MDRRDLVEARRRRQPLGRLDRRGLAAAERQEERGREDAEACVLEPVGAGDQGEAQLDRVDGLADRAERRAEVGEEEQELVSGCRLQRTRVFGHLGRRGIGIGRGRAPRLRFQTKSSTTASAVIATIAMNVSGAFRNVSTAKKARTTAVAAIPASTITAFAPVSARRR